jgi:hypothetical protein
MLPPLLLSCLSLHSLRISLLFSKCEKYPEQIVAGENKRKSVEGERGSCVKVDGHTL